MPIHETKKLDTFLIKSLSLGLIGAWFVKRNLEVSNPNKDLTIEPESETHLFSSTFTKIQMNFLFRKNISRSWDKHTKIACLAFFIAAKQINPEFQKVRRHFKSCFFTKESCNHNWKCWQVTNVRDALRTKDIYIHLIQLNPIILKLISSSESN